MTNSSSQSYKELAIPYFKETFDINFSKKYSDLHVLGFREVMDSSVQLQVEQRLVNVPPLPDILRIIDKSAKLSDRIHQVLDNNLDEINESEIAKSI